MPDTTPVPAPASVREAFVERSTRETQISVRLSLPGAAPPRPPEIATPVPFLSHMLEALARHKAALEGRRDALASGHTEFQQTRGGLEDETPHQSRKLGLR